VKPNCRRCGYEHPTAETCTAAARKALKAIPNDPDLTDVERAQAVERLKRYAALGGNVRTLPRFPRTYP
jgi:hypothetical protein